MADELYRKSAFELAAMIRARQVKPSELMEVTLRRIEAVNPKVNAFSATRADQAMAEAKELDQKIARREEVGQLAGLPLGVKDLEDTAGMATTFGSVPFKDYMPAGDSVHVARLKAAGAIVVGKTTTPEFGCTGFTRNMLSGVTRNPWNLERTPGGSSGGSGAAIASSMVPLATGSDGGGSIRIPASYTGCFGYKPSRGRIPLPMMFDLADWVLTTVPGPLTRTVRDAALYVDAAAGYHPSDPDSLPHPGISYAAMLDRLPQKLRIAFSPDFGHVIVQHDVMREVTKAVDVFKQLGYSVDVLDDEVPELGLEWLRLTATYAYACIADRIQAHRDEFGRAFLAGAESATRLGWDKVGAAQRKRTELNRWCQKTFERYDLLLTPTLPTEAFGASGPPPKEIDGKPLPDLLSAVAFTYPFNMSGHPAASVRAGFTDAGLPCGLQIVAERHRDDLVLQASYAYEQARPWNDRWPEI